MCQAAVAVRDIYVMSAGATVNTRRVPSVPVRFVRESEDSAKMTGSIMAFASRVYALRTRTQHTELVSTGKYERT